MAVHSLPHFKRSSDRDSWLIAWALTLALHAAAILIFRTLPPPAPPRIVRRFEPVRLVFESPGPEERKSQERGTQPQIFTELPPDRADIAPKKADFLSNVTSRARDRAPGGNAELPRMHGEVDAPMVKMEANGGTPSPPVAPSTPRPAEPAAPRTESPQRPNLSAQDEFGAGAKPILPSPGKTDSFRVATNRNPRGTPGSGNSDIDQPEMDNPNGNAPLSGDVSLSTTAWDYAPWLQRFGRQLMHRWIPPPAYSMGLIKDGGWAVIEVEISRSGQMLHLELLEQRGHPSLINAAEGALRSMAPIEALPADFPEQTLILHIRMIYPRVHPR